MLSVLCWGRTPQHHTLCIPSSIVLTLTVLLQDAKAAVDERRSLQTQFQLAEAAQKQAQGIEMDYEEVIHLLEEEIAEMKSQRAEKSDKSKVESRGKKAKSLPATKLKALAHSSNSHFLFPDQIQLRFSLSPVL